MIDPKLVAQLERLNTNMEALLAVAQGDSLAELFEVAKDLRTLAAKALGMRVKKEKRN